MCRKRGRAETEFVQIFLKILSMRKSDRAADKNDSIIIIFLSSEKILISTCQRRTFGANCDVILVWSVNFRYWNALAERRTHGALALFRSDLASLLATKLQGCNGGQFFMSPLQIKESLWKIPDQHHSVS